MSVTFNGAFTFSGGGFTATLAPPSSPTAGWFGGGRGISTVNRITYATDTATASERGPLSLVRYGLAATGDLTNGWFGGGKYSFPIFSTVDRITYATDTATASVRGPLSSARYGVAATGDSTNGWFGGGYGTVSRVDRITFATDTATASVLATLQAAFGTTVAFSAIQDSTAAVSATNLLYTGTIFVDNLTDINGAVADEGVLDLTFQCNSKTATASTGTW